MTPVAPTGFEVFISFKSEDERHARQVYDLLVANGLNVFFSRESLPRLGSDEYHKQIDAAIERAHHMVVVTSAAEHVTAQWVEYEWRLFLGELLAGRKRGNLITLLAEEMQIGDLPISLRNREVMRMNPQGLAKLADYTRADDRAAFEPAVDVTAKPGRLEFRPEATFGGPPNVSVLRASNRSGLIVTGGFDGALRVYDRRTRSRRALLGSRRYFLSRHEAVVTALEMSSCDRFIASGHLDGAVHVWDVEQQKELGDLPHDVAIGGLAFSLDSQTLVVGTRSGAMRFWDIASLGADAKPRGATTKPAPIVYLAFLKESGWMVTGLVNTVTGRHSLQIEKAKRPDRVLATVNLAAPFRHLDIAANGSVAVATGTDGVIRVYDWRAVADEINRGRNPRLLPLIAEFKGHSTPIADLALFPDGASLSTCAKDTLIVWNVETRQPLLRLSSEGQTAFIGIAVVEDGNVMTAALRDGRVQVFQAV